MPYQKPGAYARFVTTAGSVASAGSSRYMAIIGTGKLFFDIANEAVLRQSNVTSDLLAKGDVYDIQYVTDMPLKNGVPQTGANVYKKGTHFDLNNAQEISWKLGTEPTVVKNPTTGAGPTAFAGAITASVSADYLVRNGNFRIQITDVSASNPDLGTYSVVDNDTEEVLGEFKVGTDIQSGVIPGVNLVVNDTFFPTTPAGVDATGAPTSVTSVGDYVLITTTTGVLKTGFSDVTALPANNTIYYVSYSYKKPDEEFKPKVFFDYADIVTEYGNYDVTAAGKVVNSLALGAEIAFLNGLNPIICMQAKNDSDYEIIKAIDTLQRDIPGINNINTIVPLSTTDGVAAAALNHVDFMSDASIGKERMVYLGAPQGLAPTDLANKVGGFDNERVVYVIPGSVTKDIRDINTGKVSTRTIPASYLAIAVGALGLVNDPAEPLTNKNINGFNALGSLYTESEKNLMAGAGALIVEQYGVNMRIRHGITTSTAEVNSQEITLVQIKDYVIDSARKLLGDLYVGKKLMPTVVNDVQTTLVNILSQFVAQEIILGYSNVSVKRSSLDPRAIDVNFEIEAVYPLNYINITFSFSGVN